MGMPVMRRVTLFVMYGDVENQQLQAFTLRGSCRESVGLGVKRMGTLGE